MMSISFQPPSSQPRFGSVHFRPNKDKLDILIYKSTVDQEYNLRASAAYLDIKVGDHFEYQVIDENPNYITLTHRADAHSSHHGPYFLLQPEDQQILEDAVDTLPAECKPKAQAEIQDCLNGETPERLRVIKESYGLKLDAYHPED